jgi:hypothetical protein
MERGNPKMVLLRGERAQAALIAANEALERGEVIFARLNDSLSALRSRRDELAQKIEADLDRANHPDASPTAIPAPPAPPVLVWKFF